MLRILCVAALVAAAPQEGTWKFTKGEAFAYQVEYTKYYRILGGDPDMEGKDAYRDDLKATLKFEVLDVSDRGARMSVTFDPIRVEMGGDSNPASSVYDSAKKAENKGLEVWMPLLMEGKFTVTVNGLGRVIASEGFDLDVHLPAVRHALLGERFFHAPSEKKGALKVIHDLESVNKRFDLTDDTTLHDVPMDFVQKKEKGAVLYEGKAPSGVKIDLGKEGREFHLPGVAFIGEFAGTWSAGRWTDTAWSVTGTATVKMEGREMKVELHERYSAKRVP